MSQTSINFLSPPPVVSQNQLLLSFFRYNFFCVDAIPCYQTKAGKSETTFPQETSQAHQNERSQFPSQFYISTFSPPLLLLILLHKPIRPHNTQPLILNPIPNSMFLLPRPPMLTLTRRRQIRGISLKQDKNITMVSRFLGWSWWFV